MLLLALARTGSFEIEVEGWLGKASEEAAIGPEMARLPAVRVFCICGAKEKDESGCTQSQAVGEKLKLPGGHHFGEDYLPLTKKMLQATRDRENAPDA